MSLSDGLFCENFPGRRQRRFQSRRHFIHTGVRRSVLPSRCGFLGFSPVIAPVLGRVSITDDFLSMTTNYIRRHQCAICTGITCAWRHRRLTFDNHGLQRGNQPGGPWQRSLPVRFAPTSWHSRHCQPRKPNRSLGELRCLCRWAGDSLETCADKLAARGAPPVKIQHLCD